MDKITQEAYFRQRVLKYAAEHGVTASANRYRLSRKTVHKWKGRYDGTLGSLKDRPRTPHHSPRKQTAEEEKLVQRYARKYRGDLLLGYEKACARGYIKVYGCSAHIYFQSVSLRECCALSGSNRNPYLLECVTSTYVELMGCTLDANGTTYDAIYCRASTVHLQTVGMYNAIQGLEVYLAHAVVWSVRMETAESAYRPLQP